MIFYIFFALVAYILYILLLLLLVLQLIVTKFLTGSTNLYIVDSSIIYKYYCMNYITSYRKLYISTTLLLLCNVYVIYIRY